MKKFGLLGFPLEQSFSKEYFTEKFSKLNLTDHVFDLFPYKTIEEFSERIANEPDLKGFSVTLPHKENIMKILDELDEIAKKIGAVNCVKVENRNGRRILKGFNTDAYGFQQSIKPFLEPHHDRALILGTGGASKAVYYVLKNIGLDVWFVSRDKKTTGRENVFAYEDLNEDVMRAFHLIVNATPVGMYPDNDAYPKIPYDLLTPKHFCYDLVYKPGETMFLLKAKEKGALVMNGLDMLFHQADKAWEIWNS